MTDGEIGLLVSVFYHEIWEEEFFFFFYCEGQRSSNSLPNVLLFFVLWSRFLVVILCIRQCLFLIYFVYFVYQRISHFLYLSIPKLVVFLLPPLSSSSKYSLSISLSLFSLSNPLCLTSFLPLLPPSLLPSTPLTNPIQLGFVAPKGLPSPCNPLQRYTTKLQYTTLSLQHASNTTATHNTIATHYLYHSNTLLFYTTVTPKTKAITPASSL